MREAGTGDVTHALTVFHHEAGTPVALIGAVLRHLERSGELPSHLDDMVAAAARQVEVLERLLDQVKLVDHEDIELHTERLDLAELARQLVKDLRATVLSEHRCHVEAPQGRVMVEGDGVRLRQAITNLLDNAAKYSEPAKDIHVRVHVEVDHAVLWVTDAGTGIADPDLERIFRRYERANTDTEGMGLGLHVVWLIVQAHGGEVRAEPAPDGPGARFVVRLPAATT